MELTFSAATDVGKARDHNEDNFLIDQKLRLFVVADGMGGHAAGEIASSLAVRTIRDSVYKNRDLVRRYRLDQTEVRAVEILRVLEQALQDACTMVFDAAQEDPEKRGMGTTASALLIAGEPGSLRGFIAHVGDSRIYLCRQGQTHQLTEDHSLMNELIRRGKISQDDFDTSPFKKFKNAVTRAIGVYASVEIDTFDFDVLTGDSFLLCSDGMYAYLDEQSLSSKLMTGSVERVPVSLIEIANAGGGHDNITNIVIRVEHEPAANDYDARAEDISLRLEVLRDLPLFRFLGYTELVRVMNATRSQDFEEGEDIIHKGDVGDTMFVVLSGAVSLHLDGDQLALVTKGQHFGEMALVNRTVRSLSATASTKSRLLTIHRSDFYGIIKEEPGLAVKLLWSFVQVLAERLRTTTDELSNLRQELISSTSAQITSATDPLTPTKTKF